MLAWRAACDYAARELILECPDGRTRTMLVGIYQALVARSAQRAPEEPEEVAAPI